VSSDNRPRARQLLHPLITEKQWREAVVRFAEWHGWKVYWTWSSVHSPKGFPDLVLVRGERLIFAELKTEQGVLRGPQEQWCQALMAVPCTEYFIWRPSDEDLVWALLR
jgi:predicted carbohydrate-binding protein with CBM5 and CBM33 domain